MMLITHNFVLLISTHLNFWFTEIPSLIKIKFYRRIEFMWLFLSIEILIKV
jgi:hypothetical protein